MTCKWDTRNPQEKREDEEINRIIAIAGTAKAAIYRWYLSPMTRTAVLEKIKEQYPELVKKGEE